MANDDYPRQYAAAVELPSDDEAAFHKKIAEDKENDFPPMVYADWLDEHDQPATAEFIRRAHSDVGDGLEKSGYINPGYVDPTTHNRVVMVMHVGPPTTTRSATNNTYRHVMMAIRNLSQPSDWNQWHKWHVVYPTSEEAQAAAKGLVEEGSYPSIGVHHQND